MTVRVLSDQSVNIGQLVRVLYFGPCFLLWSVVLWWSVTSPWVRDGPCFLNHHHALPCPVFWLRYELTWDRYELTKGQVRVDQKWVRVDLGTSWLRYELTRNPLIELRTLFYLWKMCRDHHWHWKNTKSKSESRRCQFCCHDVTSQFL